jgi:hypothetical protein
MICQEIMKNLKNRIKKLFEENRNQLGRKWKRKGPVVNSTHG